jgi:rod shape determining protein RodA
MFLSFSWGAFLEALCLCLAGLGILYSAGFNPDTKQSLAMERQLLSMLIGFGLLLIFALIRPTFWHRWAWIFYAGGLVLLVLVLLTGSIGGGARRWLEFGGLRVQPSEFMKLAVILALAKVFSSENAPRNGYQLKNLIWPLVVIALPFELIRQQPDLGTALCLFLVGGSMLLVYGIRAKLFFGLSILGGLALIPAWGMLHDYQKRRVLTFMSPESDPLGAGYHAIQSKIAVGSGMIFGKGYMQGTQTQLRFLPEQTTDFIFSVLAEEWGFMGSAIVLVLYLLLFSSLVRAASKSTDSFSCFVTVGVAALLFWHVVMNIGMVTGVLPVVGLTLPLLSYGGTSVITFLSALGVVIGCTRRRFVFS